MVNLPKHLAIIMDGNGRWAQRRNRPRVFGHIKGASTVKTIVQSASQLGIEVLTLFAFSTENWKRPRQEVDFLMRLLERHLKKQERSLVKENIKLETIGDLSALPLTLQGEIRRIKKVTSSNTGMRLVFALNYGSRGEILEACKRLASKILKGEVQADLCEESDFAQLLETKDLPDPDLVIRTSGELRISNFLLWQSAYSEFYFTEKQWPDFTDADLLKALAHYSSRQRRYGGIEGQVFRPPFRGLATKELL